MSLSVLDGSLADLQRIFASVDSPEADSKVTSLLWELESKLTTETIDLGPVSSPDNTSGILYKDSPQKATIEKGLLYGYSAVWKDATGQEYIDAYGDITVPGSWNDTIKAAQLEKQQTGRAYLMPHLHNHHRDSQIGGVESLSQDSKGIVYSTKLALNVPKAQEVYELAKAGMLGTSYGYVPVLTEKAVHPVKKTPVRKLVKVHVSELSATAFPANPYSLAYAKQAKSIVNNVNFDNLLQGYKRLATIDREASNLWADLAELAYKLRER